jgi:hypothetical protein
VVVVALPTSYPAVHRWAHSQRCCCCCGCCRTSAGGAGRIGTPWPTRTPGHMKTNRRLRAVLQHTDTVRGWRRDPPISTCYGAAAAAAHPHPPHQRQHYQHQLSDLDDDLADVHRRYQADGFCVVRGFLRGGVLRQLQEELGRYLADVLPTKSTDAHYFDGEWAAAGGRGPLSALKYINDLDERPYFANFNPQHCEEVHPRWHAMAEVLTGYRMRSRGCEVFNKPPGGLSTVRP